MKLKTFLNRIPKRIRLPIALLSIYLLCIFLIGSTYWIFALEFSTPDETNEIRSLSFLEAQYVSVVTITTLGYGEFVPHSIFARLVAAFEAVLGVSLVGLIFVTIGMEISKSQERLVASNAAKEQKARLDYIYSRIATVLTEALDRFDNNRAPIQMSGGGYYRFGYRYPVLARNIIFAHDRIKSSLGPDHTGTEKAALEYADFFATLEDKIRNELDRFGYILEDVEIIKLFEDLSFSLLTQSNTLRRRTGTNCSHSSLVTSVFTDIQLAFRPIVLVRDKLLTFADDYIDGGTVRYSVGTDPLSPDNSPSQPTRGRIRTYFDI